MSHLLLCSDPNDLRALTPDHFWLVPFNSLPGFNILSMNQVERHELSDALLQPYWKRWHEEYLSTLQSWQQWNNNLNPARVGMLDFVLNGKISILEQLWLGLLFPGKDGIVWVVELTTKHVSYTRPVVK